MNVLDRTRRFVRRHDLFGRGASVAAAVSGGSDSVALAHVLSLLAASGDVRLAGIAHFDHQLRETSTDDAGLCERLAAALGVPFVSGRGDVRGRAASEHRSIEDAARRARYEFFDRAQVELGADLVALGHTRDDQAETYLLRLVRGAGPRGLASMYPRNGAIVRPLLGCRRADLRAWLAERAARGAPATAFVEDETNQDVAIPRNRIRAELLPLLESRFNPEIVDVLADEADLARDSWAIVDRAANAAAADGAELNVDRLRAMDPAVARAVLWRAMTAAAGGREIGYRHVAAAMDLVDQPGDRSIDVPGQRVERIRGRIVLVSRPSDVRGRWTLPAGESDSPTGVRQTLSIPGEVRLSDVGILTAESLPSVREAEWDPGVAIGRGPAAVVRADLCASLAVRNRRPGDRFRPVGLNGSKKLQDFFTDRKIDRHARSRVPIVVDGSDRIVWVAGHGIDEAFAVTDAAQAVLLLRLRQP